MVTRESSDRGGGEGREVYTYASWDHPGMGVVTRESTDTLTGGGGEVSSLGKETMRKNYFSNKGDQQIARSALHNEF